MDQTVFYAMSMDANIATMPTSAINASKEVSQKMIPSPIAINAVILTANTAMTIWNALNAMKLMEFQQKQTQDQWSVINVTL